MLTNVKLGCNYFTGIKHCSLLSRNVSAAEKWFNNMENLVSMFFLSHFKVRKMAECLTLPIFQAVLIFWGKAGAYLSQSRKLKINRPEKALETREAPLH